MDEELQRGVLHRRGDHADLVERQFAGEHDLREADVLQEARLFRGADVGLGAGVQLQRGQVELEQAHVLHDQRVDPGLVQLVPASVRAASSSSSRRMVLRVTKMRAR